MKIVPLALRSHIPSLVAAQPRCTFKQYKNFLAARKQERVTHTEKTQNIQLQAEGGRTATCSFESGLTNGLENQLTEV